VLIRERNIRANVASITLHIDPTPDLDRMLSFLPLHHDFGLFMGLIYPVMWDIQTFVYPTEFFIRRPSFWLNALSRTRATMCPAPQFVYQVAAQRIRDRDLEGVDLSNWRYSYNGGEPVHAQTLRDFEDRFARYGYSSTTVLPSYGMAECTLAATALMGESKQAA
jgi:acyl-CoA synthetase (AMP-forming)/AMP-acid ligase II